MKMDTYQEIAKETAIYPKEVEEFLKEGLPTELATFLRLSYVSLGLAGEAGEFANKVKKILRDGKGVMTPEIKARLTKELGGVLWYCAQVATELGIDLSFAAGVNVQELQDRKARGTLKGSGDDR
jgi:NTP pyrophosphatase (non-canonical NTP hydrolase)